MGALTETEIFDRMIDSLKAAVQACEDLAVKPMKGPSYRKLQEHLPLIEGCCRQASAWRDPQTGRLRLIPEGVKHPLFMKLAENLRGLMTSAEKLRTDATRRMGMILPDPLPGPHRQIKDNYSIPLPDGVVRRPSGLIVPSEAA